MSKKLIEGLIAAVAPKVGVAQEKRRAFYWIRLRLFRVIVARAPWVRRKPPTIKEIYRLLQLFTYTEEASEEDLVTLSPALLTMATRSQWRDAMFIADLEGEDDADDHHAFYREAGRQLSVSELAHVIEAFGIRRRLNSVDSRQRIQIARALLTIGTPWEWHEALTDES